ncbi:unnamed protein product [Rhodiola kirilowii]
MPSLSYTYSSSSPPPPRTLHPHPASLLPYFNPDPFCIPLPPGLLLRRSS